MALSILFWAALLLLLTGIVSVVWPIRAVGISSRRTAAAVSAAALAIAAAALAWPAPGLQSSSGDTRLDEFMPRWQFNERHSIHIDAAPERVFKEIHAVRSGDIVLFRTLTSIRRLGRPVPESILNAPTTKPLLEVATRSGFCLLADDSPRELVIGVVMVAPPAMRRGGHGAELFKASLPSGVALTTMNFLVTPAARGGCDVSTETRIYANDADSLRKFTTYWRIIGPGSDIIRRMWLRAIKQRAEA